MKKKLALLSASLLLMLGVFTFEIVSFDNSSNDNNRIEIKEVRDDDKDDGFKF